MHNSLVRYKLGLLVLFVLLIALLGYVIVGSASRRQDNITEAKAHAIANKLNDITLDKSNVPESLDELKITDVPSTITYQKKSETTYEFCATYKHDSNDTPATSLGDVITGAALAPYGAGLDDFGEYQDNSYLRIDKHKKGKNCQTIETYSTYKSPEPIPMGSCEYDYSKSDGENDAYYTCLDTQSRTQFN